jgi:signal transduction histidine kinase
LPISSSEKLVGGILRLRGCFTSQWNDQTRQVIGGRCFLWPAVAEVEEAPPVEPFALARRRTAELLWFDARASALQRTKIAAQIIYVRPGEYLALDERIGLRVLAAGGPELHAGDLIEAVGFPRLAGPSPVLQALEVRKTGHAALPSAVAVAAEGLLDQNRDATLVEVEATLASETVNRDGRVLELQAGPHRFAALLEGNAQHRWRIPAAGSRLRVSGVYASSSPPAGRASLAPFELLLAEAGALTVLQQPPWWTVRHALSLAAALAGTLGLAFIWITLLRRRVEERTTQLADEIKARQIVEQNRVLEQERTRVARDLHDELGAGLTEVGILGELARNPEVPQGEKANYLERLTSSARALVSNLDEIVWAINPQYDSLAATATYYSFFADRFLKLSGITCRLRIAESFPEYSLDSKVRHGVLLGLKEALNNVVRHAEATEVELRMEFAAEELAISVRDNGRGLPPGEAHPGSDGLTGMRQRLRQLGGECQILSEPGRGTTVVFRLPMGMPAGANGPASLKVLL